MSFWSNKDVMDTANYTLPADSNLTLKFDQYQNTACMNQVRMSLRFKKTSGYEYEAGYVYIYAVPYCCGMLFIADLNSYRSGKGYAKLLLDLVKRFAWLGGYKAIQCVIADVESPRYRAKSTRRINLFKGKGYKYLANSKFRNPRSQNICRTFQLTLEK